MLLFRNILAVSLVLASQVAVLGQQPDANPVRGSKEVSGQAAEEPKQQAADTDLLALMAGKCVTLSVAGHDFACRTVAYVHSVQGRAYFTIALDDFADSSHIISFSGENSQRTNDNLYDLAIDRMLLNSKTRPKVDGLPVPVAVASSGRCVQLGNFAAGHVTSVVCSATDEIGREYRLRFESDGSPITVRRVNPSAPTIRQNS
jgi:hypothetical protein